MVEKKMIPPDGGWGWLIIVAYVLNNVIMVPILQGFSLVLAEVFEKFNTPATDATIILSVNSAFGMAVGIVHGPLLRKFGYRKIALLGSILFTIGITMTAFATTFTHFMITYGLMASLGVGLSMASFSLAINTYFVIKRGRATGMAMTLTGLGPILMPQLVSYLMSSYGTQGTIIILGGMTLHSLVGVTLLQPVKWHATWQIIEPQDEQSNSIKVAEPKSFTSLAAKERKVTIESTKGPRELVFSTDAENNEEMRSGMIRSRSNTLTNLTGHADTGERTSRYKWWSSGKSLETVNLDSNKMIFDETGHFEFPLIDNNDGEDKRSLKVVPNDPPTETRLHENEKLLMEVSEMGVVPEELSKRKSVDSCWKKVFRTIVRFFDFDLLRDPIYVNMMLGMSIALFAEINFAVLTPFILADMGFSTDKIATVMSTLAGVDLISRALVPFIGEWLRMPARHMALTSLFLVTCLRTMLIFTKTFTTLIAVTIGLGLAKGLRSVNMSLVIPNYVPIERLASAMGIQMVANGLVLIVLGPLLGLFKDKFGSYVPCLLIINSTTALTIIMWTTEMCIVRERRKRRQRAERFSAGDVR